MRPTVRMFVEDAAESLPILDPVVEIGARPAAGQEKQSYLRDFFAGHPYIGCDYQSGANVDSVVDIHTLPFADGSVGTVVSCETLEHVADPLRAVREIHRVLKPGGVAILTSVMFMAIHEHPWDYWRFTPEGFELLLEPFETSLAFSYGFDLLPEGVHGVGIKGPFKDLTRDRFRRVDAMCRAWGRDHPIDLGPIRMTIPQGWRMVLRATVDAGRRRLRGGKRGGA